METVLMVLLSTVLGIALTALLVAATVSRAYRDARLVEADPTVGSQILAERLRLAA